MIDGEEQNLHSVNSTDRADKSIIDNAVDEFIATAINSGGSTDFAEDAAGGLIDYINAGNSMDCAGILISNYSSDGFIATDIDAVNLTDCSEYGAG